MHSSSIYPRQTQCDKKAIQHRLYRFFNNALTEEILVTHPFLHLPLGRLMFALKMHGFCSLWTCEERWTAGDHTFNFRIWFFFSCKFFYSHCSGCKLEACSQIIWSWAEGTSEQNRTLCTNTSCHPRITFNLAKHINRNFCTLWKKATKQVFQNLT